MSYISTRLHSPRREISSSRTGLRDHDDLLLFIIAFTAHRDDDFHALPERASLHAERRFQLASASPCQRAYSTAIIAISGLLAGFHRERRARPPECRQPMPSVYASHQQRRASRKSPCRLAHQPSSHNVIISREITTQPLKRISSWHATTQISL